MERREALRKIGASVTTASAGAMIISSPAFADGGSGNCRSTPAIGNTLSSALPSSGKNYVRVFSSNTSFSAAACGCGWTASVQRRWSVSKVGSSTAGVYNATTGGTQLSGGFGAAGASVSVGSPVYIRDDTAGTPGTYTVDLTVRHVCRSGGAVAWSCQRYRTVFTYSNSGGSTGSLSGQSSASFGPPDNSAFCDSPPP